MMRCKTDSTSLFLKCRRFPWPHLKKRLLQLFFCQRSVYAAIRLGYWSSSLSLHSHKMFLLYCMSLPESN